MRISFLWFGQGQRYLLLHLFRLALGSDNYSIIVFGGNALFTNLRHHALDVLTDLREYTLDLRNQVGHGNRQHAHNTITFGDFANLEYITACSQQNASSKYTAAFFNQYT